VVFASLALAALLSPEGTKIDNLNNFAELLGPPPPETTGTRTTRAPLRVLAVAVVSGREPVTGALVAGRCGAMCAGNECVRGSACDTDLNQKN
jgi:hypothetical protein